MAIGDDTGVVVVIEKRGIHVRCSLPYAVDRLVLLAFRHIQIVGR